MTSRRAQRRDGTRRTRRAPGALEALMRGIAEEQYRAMREAWDRARVRAAEPPAPPRDRDEVA